VVSRFLPRLFQLSKSLPCLPNHFGAWISQQGAQRLNGAGIPQRSGYCLTNILISVVQSGDQGSDHVCIAKSAQRAGRYVTNTRIFII
jgi:hypothetical protein